MNLFIWILTGRYLRTQYLQMYYKKTANEIDELKGKKQQLLIEKAGQEDDKIRIR